MNFKPLGDIVLATLETDTGEIKGTDIVKPEIAKEKPQYATVVAVGDEVTKVREGDRIYYTKFSGKPIELDDGKYQYMKEAEIIGVMLY